MKATLLTLLLAILPPALQASDWDPKMDPPLGLSLPLKTNENRVVLGADLLLTPTMVLPAGTKLRTIFRPFTVTEGEAKTRRGVSEDSVSRVNPKVTKKGMMTETERKAMVRAYETVWTDPVEFRRALETDYPDNLRFVLDPTPPATTPPIEIPDFPDGLCLIGDPTPQVLCVLKESRAAKAGFQGGDKILEMSDQPAEPSLSDFAARYATNRATAAKKQELLRFKVLRSSGQTESLVLRVPPTWNSAFEE